MGFRKFFIKKIFQKKGKTNRFKLLYISEAKIVVTAEWL